MSQPKDIDEHKADRDRLWLVELLYGELEGPSAARAESRVRDNPALAAELEEFQDLRQMMRELPDEEPPPAVTAKLLHTAALQAPAAARQQPTASDSPDSPSSIGERGLWTWLKNLFQPLFLHPGLAAATSLVLVATVAGAVYFTSDDGQLGPPAFEREAAKADAPAMTATPPAPTDPTGKANRPAEEPAGDMGVIAEGTAADPKTAQIPGGLGADEAPAGDDAVLGRADAADTRQLDAVKKRSKQKPRPARGKRGNRYAADKAGAVRDSARGRTATLADREDAVSGGAAARGGRRGSKVPAPAPEPVVQAAPRKPSTKKKDAVRNRPARRAAPATTGVASDSLDIGAGGERSGDGARAPESAPRAPADAFEDDEDADSSGADPSLRARTLYREALAAAKKDDCTTVRAKAREIQALDASFYKKRVTGNKALARCLRVTDKK